MDGRTCRNIAQFVSQVWRNEGWYKTRYSRHRGREWRVSLPPFGETIEFLKRGHKFEARWQQGIFLGVKDNTTEKIVGNASGVFTVQSIRIKSGEDRYNLEMLRSVTGVPWDPQATRDEVQEGPRPAIMDGEPSEPLAQPVVVQAPGSSAKAKDFKEALHYQERLGEVWIHSWMSSM